MADKPDDEESVNAFLANLLTLLGLLAIGILWIWGWATLASYVFVSTKGSP